MLKRGNVGRREFQQIFCKVYKKLQGHCALEGFRGLQRASEGFREALEDFRGLQSASEGFRGL